MYFEFTAEGRWFLRNDKGQLQSRYFDSFEELMENATW